MRYIQGTTEFLIQEDTAVTLGKFDGVHRGHQKLIHRIQNLKKNGLNSVVFTMNPGKKNAAADRRRAEGNPCKARCGLCRSMPVYSADLSYGARRVY